MSRYVILAAVLAAVSFEQFLLAQEAAPAKERKGPLPVHYKDIITPDQRAKIYSIQDSFDVKIDALTAQIKALQAERDAAYEAVLSPEQKEKLAKAKADAAAKRAATAAAKKPETEGEKKPAEAAAPEKPVAPEKPAAPPVAPVKKPAPAVK